MPTNTISDEASSTEHVSKVRPEAARSPWRDRDRVFTAVSVFFFFAALGYTRGVLPLHVKSLHASDVAVGLAAAANPAGELVMRWVSAPLLGRYGPRIIMMLCALALACINLSYGLAAVVPAVVVLALFHGAAVGGYGTCAATQIVSGADSEVARTTALSMYSIARITAQIAAPAMGLTLATRMGTGTVLAWAAVGGTVAFLPLLLVRSRAAARSQHGDNALAVLRIAREALRDRVLVGAVLAYFAWSFGSAGLQGFLALLGRERGIMNVGAFFTASGLLNVTGTIFLSMLVARFGADRLLTVAGALIISSLALVLTARTAIMLPIAGAIYGLGTFSVYPCLAAVAVGRLPKSTGVAVVLFMTGMDLGLTLGSISLGFVARSFGYPAVFVTGAIVYLLGLSAYRILKASGTARRPAVAA